MNHYVVKRGNKIVGHYETAHILAAIELAAHALGYDSGVSLLANEDASERVTIRRVSDADSREYFTSAYRQALAARIVES